MRVSQARGGEAALALRRGALPPIDLLLCDPRLPRMSGATLFGALRALDPELSVLLMSGYTADEAWAGARVMHSPKLSVVLA